MTVRIRVLPRFPASISGSAGIKVVRSAGSPDLLILPDFGAVTQVPAVIDPDDAYFLIWQEAEDMYIRMSFNDVFNAVSGLGFMQTSVYDPTGIEASAFDRANHTGTLALNQGGTGSTTASDARTALGFSGDAAQFGKQGTNIASASTTNIAAATGDYVVVTGTTTITAFGTAAAGVERVVRFSGALTLTHNAISLILPGAANITTAAGDVAIFRSEGSGNWRCVSYQTAAGLAALLSVAQRWSAAQTFAILQSGGTANGNAAAIVDGTATTVLQMLSSNTGTGNVYFGDVASAAVGRITYNHNDDSLQFWANAAERGRFVSTGEFMVGRSNIALGAADDGVVIDPAGAMILAGNGTGVRANVYFVNNAAATPATVGSITTNLSVTAYNTSSDANLKTNFRDFDSGEMIDAIQTYRFDWINGGSAYGVKAQECFEVFPDAVTQGRGTPGDADYIPWSADYSKFVPLLLHEVKLLRARVADLEARA